MGGLQKVQASIEYEVANLQQNGHIEIDNREKVKVDKVPFSHQIDFGL